MNLVNMKQMLIDAEKGHYAGHYGSGGHSKPGSHGDVFPAGGKRGGPAQRDGGRGTAGGIKKSQKYSFETDYDNFQCYGRSLPDKSFGRKCWKNICGVCLPVSAWNSSYCARRTDNWTFGKECEKIYGARAEYPRALRRE